LRPSRFGRLRPSTSHDLGTVGDHPTNRCRRKASRSGVVSESSPSRGPRCFTRQPGAEPPTAHTRPGPPDMKAAGHRRREPRPVALTGRGFRGGSQTRSRCPPLTRPANARHASGPKTSFGPSGSFESRTATAAPERATSTYSAPDESLRLLLFHRLGTEIRRSSFPHSTPDESL